MNRLALALFQSVIFIGFLVPVQNQLLAFGQTPIDPAVLERLEWRSIGPANMGGRTTDIEGVPGRPELLYVATASGGLWKTSNGGVTWTPIFERQGTISIGDVALDPQNPDVVWVGTGEANVRNSVSFGDGVYKSTDGGKTWKHVGLRNTERISRIVINPRNPDVVYVGALGHAFGPNQERGVFMTVDGGATWQKTLFIDAGHGVADMDIDASNPNILYAAMWHFERKPWTHRSGSEKGGVFKSVDGGRTWSKLEKGLPVLMGRVGVKVAPGNPNVVYVITESKDGTLYRSDDRGEKFKQMTRESKIVSRGFYYTDLRVDPINENRVYAVASILSVSDDGGKTFRRISSRTHVDNHALWIDPVSPNRMWQGQDGGIAVSYDRGDNWEYVNNIPIGQFYQIHADQRTPFYFVSGGLQDNGTWVGPSRTREPAGIMNDDWRLLSFGDGFHVISHPDDPDVFLSESQAGNILRTDTRTREQQDVSPQPRRNDGGPVEDLKYRFNWNAPIVFSPHDKHTVYFGSNVLFKSADFGRTWAAISPDLTTNDREKQKPAGGPVWFENTAAEYHCTIISVAESPTQPGMIWVGTDDGNLQVTIDGGTTWANVIKNVPDLLPNSPVSHVEPSRTSARVAFVSFDRHMLDDFRPYVFRTTDGGRTWENITGNLPETAYVWVVKEDPRNTNLIYAGTELGLYASYSGGVNWISLGMKNLPNVAVHDILVHPRENDLILGTHGRSIWVFDDATPIQQLNGEIVRKDLHLFDSRPALRFATRFTRYGIGNKVFVGPNPPYGAQLTYYLKDEADSKTSARMEIFAGDGTLIREIKDIPKGKGLNRASWDLRTEKPRLRRPPSEEEVEFTGGPRGPQVLPGNYRVRITVGERVAENRIEVRLDPSLTIPEAHLRSQYEFGLKLRDMLSATNDALKALDSIKDQLKQLENTVKDRLPDTPGEVTDIIANRIKRADSMMEGLARPEGTPGFALGPKLSELISGLFFKIDGTNAAPTSYQQDLFADIKAEFQEKIGDVNTFIGKDIPGLNETLRKSDLSIVIPGRPIDLGT